METVVKARSNPTGLYFWLVEDANDAGRFISAIVCEEDERSAISMVRLFHKKELGEHTHLVARQIELERRPSILYSVARK